MFGHFFSSCETALLLARKWHFPFFVVIIKTFCITVIISVIIRFRTLVLVSAPSNLLMSISTPILISTPIEKSTLLPKNASLPIGVYIPISTPYSVSVLALLGYMHIKINRGPFSFNCSLKASLQKECSSSQSLNLNVHVTTQFL